MKLKVISIVLLLLFSVGNGLAQKIELVTSVSKSKIGIHQRVRIEYTVNRQGADDFELPSFENFEVIAGPSSSISQSWVNGKTSYSQAYIYILKPKKIGTFELPAASIVYKGETVYSNSVTVYVVSEAEIPRDPNDPAYIASENVHLVTEISKAKPYLGEGIYVVYKLYFSHNVGFSDWRITDVPQYNGFWNQDIDVESEVKNTTYRGEKYRYIELKRALLIPQKSGELEIQPINMDIQVQVPTGRGDFFGNAITRSVNHTTKSRAKTVMVQDLPLIGRPADFSGAVGDFDFSVTASKDVLKSNETTQLKVEVSGKGNLKLFDLPEVETPSELEVFTPEYKENVRTTLNGLSGTVADNYTLVPEFKGKYIIPEVSFSYFSLKDKEYKSLTSSEIVINVAEGKSLPTESKEESSAAVVKQNVVATDNNFRYISTRTVFKPLSENLFFKSTWFYTLLLLPFLAIPIGIFIGVQKEKRDGDIVGKRQRKADKLARKYLSQAKKKLGVKEEFYIALEKALHNFLKAKLSIETTDISQDKIADILEDRSVNLDVIKDFIGVLNDCDFARYTPTTNLEMQQEFEKAKIVITKIDKQLR